MLTLETLELPPGCLLALIGPNGSGKSTLITAIAGLLVPAAGDLEVEGRWPPARGSVAAVFQSAPLHAGLPLSVERLVATGRDPHLGLWRRRRADDRRAVREAMERLDIGAIAGRQLAELSGGQRQRARVAQALATEAPVLLLDEPTAGLDLPSRERILAVLDDERRRGTTVVLASHDLAEARRADRVLLLDGEVIADGQPAHVLTDRRIAATYGPGQVGGRALT